MFRYVKLYMNIKSIYKISSIQLKKLQTKKKLILYRYLKMRVLTFEMCNALINIIFI